MKRYILPLFAGLLLCTETPAQTLELTPERCREMAVAHSEELRKAGNALQQAELDRKIATTASLPSLEGSAMGAYMLPDFDMMGTELRMRGSYMAGITLTQPIYAGGKITAAQRLARIGAEAAEEQLQMTRAEVLSEADNAYWTLVAVERKVRMTERYMTLMDTLLNQTLASVRSGMALDNDRLRVEARRSEILYQLHRARNGADLCRMSLCRIIGVGPDTRIVPTDTLLEAEAPGRLDGDISARPELHLLERQLEASEEQIRMTRADYLPQIGLSAGYSYFGNIKLHGSTQLPDGTPYSYTQEFRDGMGLAMLAVRIPIFHWGEGRKKTRRARLDLENARLDLERNSRLMDLEAQQAIRNVEDGYRFIEAAAVALRQAEESLRVMQNRHAASMASLTDLLDAQAQWQQAQSNYIEAQTQYRIYRTEYLRTTGQLR